MARGKRTDPIAAILAKVMHEMGFELGLIVTASGLPRGTVKDITEGAGPWREMPRNELYDLTRERLTASIDAMLYNVATKAMANLERKLETASFMELLNFVGVGLNRGESWR